MHFSLKHDDKDYEEMPVGRFPCHTVASIICCFLKTGPDGGMYVKARNSNACYWNGICLEFLFSCTLVAVCLMRLRMQNNIHKTI